MKLKLTQESGFKCAAVALLILIGWGGYEWWLEGNNVAWWLAAAVVAGIIGFTYSMCQAWPDLMMRVTLVMFVVSFIMMLLGSATIWHILLLDWYLGSEYIGLNIMILLGGIVLFFWAGMMFYTLTGY